jgi:hypothetical protein
MPQDPKNQSKTMIEKANDFLLEIMNEWKKDYIPFQEQPKDFDPSVSTEAKKEEEKRPDFIKQAEELFDENGNLAPFVSFTSKMFEEREEVQEYENINDEYEVTLNYSMPTIYIFSTGFNYQEMSVIRQYVEGIYAKNAQNILKVLVKIITPEEHFGKRFYQEYIKNNKEFGDGHIDKEGLSDEEVRVSEKEVVNLNMEGTEVGSYLRDKYLPDLHPTERIVRQHLIVIHQFFHSWIRFNGNKYYSLKNLENYGKQVFREIL